MESVITAPSRHLRLVYGLALPRSMAFMELKPLGTSISDGGGTRDVARVTATSRHSPPVAKLEQVWDKKTRKPP